MNSLHINQEVDMTELRKEIEHAINRVSAENGSNTPDFILAEFLTDSLAAFDKAVSAREKWYGRPIVNPERNDGRAPLAERCYAGTDVKLGPDGGK